MKPFPCTLCGGIARRQVGKSYFCKAHTAEAFALAAAEPVKSARTTGIVSFETRNLRPENYA